MGRVRENSIYPAVFFSLIAPVTFPCHKFTPPDSPINLIPLTPNPANQHPLALDLSHPDNPPDSKNTCPDAEVSLLHMETFWNFSRSSRADQTICEKNWNSDFDHQLCSVPCSLCAARQKFSKGSQVYCNFQGLKSFSGRRWYCSLQYLGSITQLCRYWWGLVPLASNSGSFWDNWGHVNKFGWNKPPEHLPNMWTTNR